MESKEQFFQPQRKVAHPFLFRAKNNNNYLYFLGTYHQLPITVLPENIIQYMSQSSVLCCERIGITKEEIDLQVLLEPFDDSPNNCWYDLLTDDTKEIIDLYLEPFISKKFPHTPSRQLKPEWVMAELGAAMHSNAMDISIRNMFNKDKKLLFQLDRNISIEDWSKLRDYTKIGVDNKEPEKFSRAIYMKAQGIDDDNSYLKETIERQLEILETASLFVPKDLSEERNATWISKLKNILNEHDSIFIAAGCAHYAGESGLLIWLQESGYDLELLNNKGIFEAFNYKPEPSIACNIQ
jgi:hypothetical protein